ncbi:MAG: hypothetical protein WKF34_04610 [Pyrinomonadaceae bacterium]
MKLIRESLFILTAVLGLGLTASAQKGDKKPPPKPPPPVIKPGDKPKEDKPKKPSSLLIAEIGVNFKPE